MLVFRQYPIRLSLQCRMIVGAVVLLLIVSSRLLYPLVHAQAPAALLFDNFDTENGGHFAENFNKFTKWDVTAGTVDLVGTGYQYDIYPGHGFYVDLDGSTYSSGTLTSKQTFDLAPGVYTLSFKLGGSLRGDTNTVIVRLGNLYAENFTLSSDAPLDTITRVITIQQATSAKLSFAQQDAGDQRGLILDDVLLRVGEGSLTYPVFMPLIERGS